jgi:hypothetical protein
MGMHSIWLMLPSITTDSHQIELARATGLDPASWMARRKLSTALDMVFMHISLLSCMSCVRMKERGAEM